MFTSHSTVLLVMQYTLLAEYFFLVSFFSMYEIVCISGILRSWLVLCPREKRMLNKPITLKTRDPINFVHAKKLGKKCSACRVDFKP